MSTVSPSLAEVLRLCPLRAGLSRTAGANQFVLGQPKAWLGTAYHTVLEEATSGSAAAAHDAAWTTAISQQHDRVRLHPLDQRFGTPERWPSYHLVRAMALLRAQEIASTALSDRRPNAPKWTSTAREQSLSCANGRLVGRPDLIRGDAVIDYKTGDIHESDGTVAKASYVCQLQIYALLVKENTGKWPARGVLLPMEGPPLEIQIEPAACERAGIDALDLLDQYNRKVEAGGLAASLANPSPVACRWCPYQILCPAFWATSNDSSSEGGRAAAIGGSTSASPSPIHSGAAFALSILVDSGTEPLGEIVLAPLRSEIHAALSLIQAATHVRATGLARRADGTVVPTMRTVLARSEGLPAIVMAGERRDGLTVP